jgi:hypothetical protein
VDCSVPRKSYGTSLTQDNAWCIPPDENLFWFVEGDGWTPEITEVLDRCLERIIYFGMAWITYWLLHTDTHHPEHPGKFLDYAPAWDFEINLLPHAGGVDVQVLGYGREF